MVEGKKRTIFAVLNHEAGRGPARLRRLVWDQEIAGSNPAAPTTKAVHEVSGFFVRESENSISVQCYLFDSQLIGFPSQKFSSQTATFLNHLR